MLAPKEYSDRDYQNYLMHHGIKGQSWGERNGPPYPLDQKTHNQVINSAVVVKKKSLTDSKTVKRMSKHSTVSEYWQRNHPDQFKKMKNNGDFGSLPKLDPSADKDEVRLNINHDPDNWNEFDMGRHYNCQNCACAFELVERGYNVRSQPMKNGSNVGDIAKYFKNGKLSHVETDYKFDPSDNDEDSMRYYDEMSISYKKLEKALVLSKDSRGIVVVGWTENDWDHSKKATGFHAMNYIVKNGELKMYDAQSSRKYEGTVYCWDYVFGADPREFYYMRTDNLELDPSIVQTVMAGGKNK